MVYNKIRINNVNIYGINESVIASGYPFLTDDIERMKHIDILSGKDRKRFDTLFSAKHGSGHDCFAKGITVQFDLTAPEYFCRQLDRYHFIDYVSSQSKMHCIKKFDLDKMMNDCVDPRILDILKEKVYNGCSEREIVSNVPAGFMMTARMTTNLLQLKSILYQRERHKLEEWKDFCHFILTVYEEIEKRLGRLSED